MLLYRIGRLADNTSKLFVLQCVAGQDGQIRAGGIMIFTVQSVGCFKGGMITAVISGLLCHSFTKTLHRTADVFRYGNGSVVVGFQHQGIKKVGQEKTVTGTGPEMNFGGGSGIFGECNNIRQVSLFQSVQTGHDFCGACHGKLFIFVFSEQNPLILSVH